MGVISACNWECGELSPDLSVVVRSTVTMIINMRAGARDPHMGREQLVPARPAREPLSRARSAHTRLLASDRRYPITARAYPSSSFSQPFILHVLVVFIYNRVSHFDHIIEAFGSEQNSPSRSPTQKEVFLQFLRSQSSMYNPEKLLASLPKHCIFFTLFKSLYLKVIVFLLLFRSI